MIEASLDSDSHVSDASNLISIMAKYSILVTCANMSTLFVAIWMVTESVLGTSLFGWVVVSIDCFIKVLCVYLQFAFGNRLFKILCYPCKQRCNKSIESWTNKKIQNLEKISSSQEMTTLTDLRVKLDV